MALFMLAGCSAIKQSGDEETENSRPGPIRERPEYNDHQSLFFPMSRRSFSEKHQMEDITSQEIYDALEGFDGRGYIMLEENRRADFELNVPSTQHYTIGIKALSEGAVAVLTADGVRQGAYYISSDEFAMHVLYGIYLEAGVNRMSLIVLRGTAYIDYITVNDFELPESRFSVSRLPANDNASNPVRWLMDYFGETFGNRVLLAQHVTPGTNTEIGAIFEATGRFPAIRVSDLMHYSRSFTGAVLENDDIELALEWAESGGIVSYDWTWYSPPVNGGRSHFSAEAADLNLNDAFTTSQIADLDAERVKSLYEAGAVSQTCYELVLDIDHMAEVLTRLRDENVVVLWRPLHQAGTRWFWWGDCEPEAYRWLWRLMFTRFSDYHGLNNLIWVWSGQDAEYYPGDRYVDIIGEDIYNTDETSNLPRFIGTADYSGRRKMAAMTECGLLPSPDLLNRDRAMWLWTALYRGDYLTDQSGQLNYVFNPQERLERAYNHELTVTLDKLPEEF
jgi:mannan endo-1,4-beta-mannosidase